jgi:signal peptidase I
MNNTLDAGDRVLVSLLTPGVTPLQRGDVVVFEDPGGWLRPSAAANSGPVDFTNLLAFLGLAAPTDDSHLIKRIIGMPGDTVSCCNANGSVTVNGTPLVEPYVVVPPGQTRADKFTFSVTVPTGSLWVMGDNRYDSADSAYWYSRHDSDYFVPISAVVGRAMVINWPIGRWAYLDDYPSTFGTVSHPQPSIVPQG